jgi:hypothetical protein
MSLMGQFVCKKHDHDDTNAWDPLPCPQCEGEKAAAASRKKRRDEIATYIAAGLYASSATHSISRQEIAKIARLGADELLNELEKP